MGKINDSIVAERPRLSELMNAIRPSAVTRGGKEYVFDQGTLRKFAENLPQDVRIRLRLPIIFYFDSHVADSCFLTDEIAFDALQILGELSSLRTIREGKLWAGKAIVYHLIRKYPTLIQIMMC